MRRLTITLEVFRYTPGECSFASSRLPRARTIPSEVKRQGGAATPGESDSGRAPETEVGDGPRMETPDDNVVKLDELS